MMKKGIFTLVLAAGVMFFSCSGNEIIEEESIFEVSPLEISADPSGDQAYITVHSSEDWLVRSDRDWAKPETSSGVSSSEAVRVSILFDENTGQSGRTAILTVKTLGGKSIDVKVSQEPMGDGPVSEKGIADAEDLMDFARAVNEGSSLGRFMKDGEVILLQDIDASSIEDWIPIGTRETPFTGNFNGREHSVYNINWSVNVSDAGCAGFFGYLKNAAVRDLVLGRKGDNMTVTAMSDAARIGAIAGVSDAGEFSGCTNNVNLLYKGQCSGQDLHLGGICGLQTSDARMMQCVNSGNVITSSVARAAGLVGYNEGEVRNSTNQGCILASRSGETGPAWGCSYNRNPSGFEHNTGKGHVGDYNQYKDSPESAPWDAYLNAVSSPSKEGYDLESVTVDCTRESYYDWTAVESSTLSPGVTFTKYSCNNVPRMIHVLEMDLANPNVEVTTSFANDCVPNPNGNKNSNNGFNIRETLSQLCQRKRNEGENIIAGVNSGFFDSNDGIPRGFHIECGHPVYINNPDVVNRLPNHSWGFTVFDDGTASCGTKKFSGKIEVGGKEYSWYSMNDTIMRHSSSKYHVNLYDYHYKETPHPSVPALVNRLASDVLYVIAEYQDKPMEVNKGYAAAKVVNIFDGRSSALAELPYITSDKQVGIALSGSEADAVKGAVSKGDDIRLKCDMEIDGNIRKPVLTQNSSMFRIMLDGKDNTSSIPGNNQSLVKKDPVTFPVVSEDGKKVWIVEVDGRQGWYSTGVKAYEMYRIANKLGGSDVTRFDGGGSSVMWVWDQSSGKGRVVNSVSDSKGERSCMNYILIKAK